MQNRTVSLAETGVLTLFMFGDMILALAALGELTELSAALDQALDDLTD